MMTEVALCVGHSRKIKGRYDGGAVSVGGVSERDYNLGLAREIYHWLTDLGVTAEIVSDYTGSGYATAMGWLAGYLKARKAKLAVELHFNASNGNARGHEWLHWHSSVQGRLLALRIGSELKDAIPELPLRALSRSVSPGGRGAEFFIKTHCPSVICEPFFGDNAEDWAIAEAKKETLAEAMAKGIRNHLRAGGND